MSLMSHMKRMAGKLLGQTHSLDLRPSDVFIVSYPKSGGSWFYTLIANALRDPGVKPYDLFTAPDVIPDINGPYFEGANLSAYANLPDPRKFFVHAPFDARLPRVLYVLRDVRDVLVSYFHWQLMRRPGFELSLEQMIASDEYWPCRWDIHARGWLLDSHDVPVHCVRYEDLLADTPGQLTQVMRFLGVDVEPQALARAADESSFKRMRNAENANSEYQQKKLDKKENFVRKGRSGTWREELSDVSHQMVLDKYGPVMERLGYSATGVVQAPDSLRLTASAA